MPRKGFTKASLSKMDLQQLYFDCHLSQSQIAAKEGCSRSCISRLFKKYGMQPRTNAESQTAINITRSPTLTEQQKQLIYGSLLGDACLHRSVMKSNKTDRNIEIYKLYFYHTEKYLGYVEHKADVLGTGVKTKKRCKLSSRMSGHGSIMRGFAFSHTPTLRKIAVDCLDADYKKQVTKQWLDQLNWQGLAYWFMDDGCLRLNGHRQQAALDFSTQSFCIEEIELLIQLFKQFGIHAITGKVALKNRLGHILIVNRQTDVWEFLRKTEPYVVPCMRYKNRILRNNWETIDAYHHMQQSRS